MSGNFQMLSRLDHKTSFVQYYGGKKKIEPHIQRQTGSLTFTQREEKETRDAESGCCG